MRGITRTDNFRYNHMEHEMFNGLDTIIVYLETHAKELRRRFPRLFKIAQNGGGYAGGPATKRYWRHTILSLVLSLPTIVFGLAAVEPANAQVFANTASMKSAREEHTATLLRNGKVLVAGGCSVRDTVSIASAELYDPASATWKQTGLLTTRRCGHTATLLGSGSVLIAGGDLVVKGKDVPVTLSSAELYNPATGNSTVTGFMSTPAGVSLQRCCVMGEC
jgi:hypothetical protein